jgi:hypothetical protein
MAHAGPFPWAASVMVARLGTPRREGRCPVLTSNLVLTSRASAVILLANPEVPKFSSTREVRGRIAHWEANKWPVFAAPRLSISSQIFQVLLFVCPTCLL